MKIESKIKLANFNDLFGIETLPEISSHKKNDDIGNKVIEMSFSNMHSFKNHPFKVLHDEKMEETVESIKKYGILQPGLVRSDPSGGYEIISGHRRCEGGRLAGLTSMPVIIKDISDDEAIIIMVDSNIQREDILPSEKANAYKLKMAAQKRLSKDNSDDSGIRSDQIVADAVGESRCTIQRYIRLTYLNSDLLDMVDSNKLGFIAGEHLSFLSLDQQTQLVDYINHTKIIPSSGQAESLKEYSKQGTLNSTVFELVLKKNENIPKVTLNHKTLGQYFPSAFGKKEMENVIIELLEQWHKNNIIKEDV